ncbi:hypothetical protein H6P81_009988 [Aristolochia fimbriata]|uniref:Uncharacterized protein n=1 Tax=Aristolochia fimbriata TaxID=158543 RepID=A0AAV7EMF1_ARIFI|nr:hypothetical protein H6P81_009988 [Aristolochia fimbriata]
MASQARSRVSRCDYLGGLDYRPSATDNPPVRNPYATTFCRSVDAAAALVSLNSWSATGLLKTTHECKQKTDKYDPYLQ